MQVSYREIVEVAAFMALDGVRTSRSSAEIPAQRLHDTMRLSQIQLKLWLSAAESSAKLDNPDNRHQRRELIEEILISEPRVRMLGAVLASIDGSQSGHGLLRISRQLLSDHGQAKRVALSELLADSLPIGTLVQINGLRRRMERWTDLLLGVAGGGVDAFTFGFDEQRVREHRRTNDRNEPQLGRLIFSGLRQAVPRRQVQDGVRARTHRSLHECILGLVNAANVPEDCVARTRLQHRIFADHLTTDRPGSGTRMGL